MPKHFLTHRGMIIPSMVSSPETSSGQAMAKTYSYNHMKRPCIKLYTHRGMIISAW